MSENMKNYFVSFDDMTMVEAETAEEAIDEAIRQVNDGEIMIEDGRVVDIHEE
jgi:formylmethanofuran dehydrogenase subunit A